MIWFIIFSGEPDPRVIHSAEEIMSPEITKYGMNIWLSERKFSSIGEDYYDEVDHDDDEDDSEYECNGKLSAHQTSEVQR